MAKFIISKFDRLIDIAALLTIAAGGMLLHTLTALTIKSYYGDIWGYVSFLLPGLAELYLAVIQIADRMFNYHLLLGYFAAAIAISIISVMAKNRLKAKLLKEEANSI